MRVDGYTEDVGSGPGVVVVRPSRADWTYHGHVGDGVDRRPVKLPMSRVQLPVAPETVRTVQTAQGMSMDSDVNAAG